MFKLNYQLEHKMLVSWLGFMTKKTDINKVYIVRSYKTVEIDK